MTAVHALKVSLFTLTHLSTWEISYSCRPSRTRCSSVNFSHSNVLFQYDYRLASGEHVHVTIVRHNVQITGNYIGDMRDKNTILWCKVKGGLWTHVWMYRFRFFSQKFVWKSAPETKGLVETDFVSCDII